MIAKTIAMIAKTIAMIATTAMIIIIHNKKKKDS